MELYKNRWGYLLDNIQNNSDDLKKEKQENQWDRLMKDGINALKQGNLIKNKEIGNCRF